MDGQAILTVSGAVVALTALVKWSGLKDSYGALASLLFALLGVGLWAYSKGAYRQDLLFDYFAGVIAVATSAAGVFGYTRSLPAAVTVASPRSAMPGSFQNPTEKPGDVSQERRDR